MTLSKRSRILLALAALLLAAAYVLPLWSVSLIAPQYPEGLGMRIWLNTISGAKPNDLENINNLNHYIGMKRIVPESIPELRLMPIAVGALLALGLAVAALGRRSLARVWVGLFLFLAVAGLIDFYRWEYDYGHNLDTEDAIIKVPGMNYQPPLIGSKKLLNFTATSYPALGGICVMASLGLGVLVLFAERGSGPRPAAIRAAEDRAVSLVA